MRYNVPNVTQIYTSCKENQSNHSQDNSVGVKGGMLLFWAPLQRSVMYVYSHENGMCLAAPLVVLVHSIFAM